MTIQWRRGRVAWIAVLTLGIVFSGIGLWKWDSNYYPLPEPVENWLFPRGSRQTGFKYEIIEGIIRLRNWKDSRKLRQRLRAVSLEEEEWNYALVPLTDALARPNERVSTQGKVNFRGDGKAIFDPPISTREGPAIPRAVNFNRTKFDGIVLSWEDRLVTMILTETKAKRPYHYHHIRGEWNGRELRLWRW